MIRAVLHAGAVKARLLAMSDKRRRGLYRRALKAAAKPVVEELRTAWTGAKRRNGRVTRVIAEAQHPRVSIKRQTGIATLQIGTNYKVGGFAKVWHILENGFRHYGKHNVYRATSAEVKKVKAERAAYFDGAVGDTTQLVRTSAGRNELRARYRAVRQAWISQHGDKERILNASWNDRNARRADARNSGGRSVHGRRVSRSVASRHVQTLARRAQDILVARLMKATRRRKAS